MSSTRKPTRKRLLPSKKIGRPLDDAEQGMRGPTIGFRPWAPMYEQLRRSAEAANWSMSAEIEARLKQTFDDDSFRSMLAGRPETLSLIRMILTAINFVEMHPTIIPLDTPFSPDTKRWNEDASRANQLFEVLLILMYTVLVEGVVPIQGREDYESYASEVHDIMRSNIEKGEKLDPENQQARINAHRAWSVLMAAGFISASAAAAAAAAADSERRSSGVSKFKVARKLLEYIRAYPESKFFPARFTQVVDSMATASDGEHLTLVHDQLTKLVEHLEKLRGGVRSTTGGTRSVG